MIVILNILKGFLSINLQNENFTSKESSMFSFMCFNIYAYKKIDYA